MQRGVINLTMPEIQLLKEFAQNHPPLQSTKMLEKIMDWQPEQVTDAPYDVELTLEDAETVIDTLQSVLHENEQLKVKLEALLAKFNAFYSEKNAQPILS